ncbi:MAG TPA: hypothetical protein VIH61_10370 [Waddliaceae bacterium]
MNLSHYYFCCLPSSFWYLLQAEFRPSYPRLSEIRFTKSTQKQEEIQQKILLG